jgi:hypothetical protein
MFSWNAFILTKQTVASCSVTKTFQKVNFPSHDRVCDYRIRNVNHLRAIIVLSTKVNNLSFWKFRIFTSVSMPREWAVGMVQAIMTHQAVADHFNVSIIIIVRLMIHLRQTGSTNDRLRNDRPCVTSQRQDRHLRLIHLRNCRTPGLPNIRI